MCYMIKCIFMCFMRNIMYVVKHVKDTELNLWWSWIKLQFHQREFVDDHSNRLYTNNMPYRYEYDGIWFYWRVEFSIHAPWGSYQIPFTQPFMILLILCHFYSNTYKISIMTSSQCSIATADWCKLDKYRYV